MHKEIYIPKGISFGNKMAIIPPIPLDFCHSGEMENHGRINEGYTWIDRGADLGRYTIHVDKVDIPFVKYFIGAELRKASIPCPVSGLLIHSSYGLGSGLTAILLPDDEPVAEKPERMFRSFVNLVRDQKRYFMKPSRYWTQGEWSEEGFENRLQELMMQQVKFIDAMPNYNDYFEEARSRYPSLRPYLKHLL